MAQHNGFVTSTDELRRTKRLKKNDNRMKDHFIKSCELEYLFWEMAYAQEKWPLSQLSLSK